MTKQIETVIIGGSQAGLSLSYHLSRAKQEHIILERASAPGDSWRNHRWESFTLVTPNWMCRLPGMEYDGSDPDGYLPRDQVAQLLVDYADKYKMPVSYGMEVTAVDQTDGGFLVSTLTETFLAANVVIATGTYQRPKIPDFAGRIDPKVHQIHTSEYKQPAQLEPGAVLVVGAGQSGLQIAEELYQSGKTVYCSISNVLRVPRRYRGKDITYWYNAIGNFDRTVDKLPSPQAKFTPFPQVSGKNGGHTLNLHQFARDGVVLLGHMQDASGTFAHFSDDLMGTLQKIDASEKELLTRIDEHIREQHLNVPEEEIPQLTDGYMQPVSTSLDLKTAGITNIVWGSGYRFNYGMVHLPIFDPDGYPIQQHGVTSVPGIFFLGLVWMYKGNSSLLAGVGEDAKFLSEQIIARMERFSKTNSAV